MNLKLDMAEWEWRMRVLEDCPQSEVEELKAAIREDWEDQEKREYWIWRIQDEAAFSRELKSMGNEMMARLKANARMDA